MPLNGFMMNNLCLIAAAGAGKTTYIIEKAIDAIKADQKVKVLIITLTLKNQDNIKERINQLPIKLAKRIRVSGWYQFLLKYIIRPYKGDVIPELYDRNISMHWSEANQTINYGKYQKPRYSANDTKAKYLKNGKIYKNYLSEFASECIAKNQNTCMNRLRSIFSHIFIDESQDMAGFDFEVIKSLLFSSISITIVGDPRQHTYVSNTLRKHKQYKGRVEKFLEEKINTKKKKIVNIDYTTLNVSHRCGAEICEVASLIHEDFPPTLPCLCESCSKKRLGYLQGVCRVFYVQQDNIEEFIRRFSPVALTHSITTRIHPYIKQRMNMGESKGLGMKNCLIYPTNPMLDFLKSGKDLAPVEKAKLYVAITRATHIVGIAIPQKFISNKIKIAYWDPSEDIFSTMPLDSITIQ